MEPGVYPGHWGKVASDKVAVIVRPDGEHLTHGQLNDRSNQLAHLFWGTGLRPGDHVAVLLENHISYLEIAWAALRSGLYLTTVNRYLTADEAAYIVEDCDAQVLITSRAQAEVAAGIRSRAPGCRRWLMVNGAIDGFEAYEEALVLAPAEPLVEEPLGELMFYSSGTTGRPKGIVRPLSGVPVSSGLGHSQMLRELFGFDEHSVYLSTAPLYHTAALGFSLATTALGGTVIVLDHFDPADALNAIERYEVTHSQWVPTMFSRMLKLPEEERSRFGLSSHRVAIHAAAPCPPAVKEAMFDWWGPIIHEYYGGTENNGATYASPQDWLAHPGTVGRPFSGQLRVCAEDGHEVPNGDIGLVYFEQPVQPFSYYKDAAQTISVQHPQHPNWTTLGDMGRVDDEGFLYLTDRATFMIVSGGVNIYPQEIENCLVLHSKVEDAAVFGIPNPDMGEEVKAVVQLRPGIAASPELEGQLIAFCRDRLAHFKCPRSVDFEVELPRLPTGKLYKLVLRDRYRGSASATR
jgi:fatty-acyl-CoA synthase